MQYTIVEHPLIAHKLTVLRDKNTIDMEFHRLVEELVTLLAYEATRDVKVEDYEIETPITQMIGKKVSEPRPIIVPILRAGLGMLEGMLHLLPFSPVGFLGMQRNEETLQPVAYAHRLPNDLTGIPAFIIDPMLATGGTLIDSINYLFEHGARKITCICILSAPEGVKALHEKMKPLEDQGLDLQIFVAAEDDHLNENGYIVPGLGDAGDRLYGLSD